MRIIVALLAVCIASATFWASLDKPLSAPDWTGEVRGLAYSPSRLYSEKDKDENVTEELIRRDLAQLSTMTKRIRTYTVDYNHDRIPYVAKEFGMKVSLGIWLRGDKDYNETEIARALKVIADNPDVIDRVFVGNEAVGVRAELTGREVSDYIKRVKAEINKILPPLPQPKPAKAVKGAKAAKAAAPAPQRPRIEVGTAEVWPTWLTEKELADGADFIGIHLLPYWEGVSYEKSMDYITDSYEQIAKLYPNQKIVIGETGWPSDGRVKKGSVPSPAFEAAFLRKFFHLAEENNYDYYIMEAYDQPWKGSTGQEGAVGAFWGMLDAQGNPKFSLTGQLSSFTEWAVFAGIAAGGTFLLGLLVLTVIPKVSVRGHLLLAAVISLIVSGGLFIIEASSLTYIDFGTIGGMMVIVPAALFTATLLLTETAEWTLSLWRKNRKPEIAGTLGYFPRVSIHVPTHNEPPLMVMQTLNALAKLDYPNFEVIVLDNNTSDESLWRPVASHCESLGAKFRFYHLDNVKGFKAGALNKALELTDPGAEFIGVIDSDYQVAPNWLRVVLPGFADEKVGIVQAPQDYRDANESLFKHLLYEEYTGFFRIGMVERNEHNAIIQHGTMCVVRRKAMDEVGGWAEWCITEDTELGLRIFEAGYTALYTQVSMGRGLMPDTYAAYKGQRYRWVYGAMQILKRHSNAIFKGKKDDGSPSLTPAQRYQFVAGWMPWFADGFALVFGVLALVWSALMIAAPRHFDVPLTALSGVALTLFTIKTVKTIWLHRAKVGTGFGGSLASALTGLSLSYTVGKGVITGLLTSSKPFLRTPKCEDKAPWTQIFIVAKAEALMLLGTVVAIFGTMWSTQFDDPADVVWVAALTVMAVPYASALMVALFSTLKPNRPVAQQPDIGPSPVLNPPKVDVAA
jgi:cellulose synthase/poly-beta-1,6-N-acetylglucosamine synthase-like glycosyltransferase/exo-beta-1,3-glucanase (GH17 family)